MNMLLHYIIQLYLIEVATGFAPMTKIIQHHQISFDRSRSASKSIFIVGDDDTGCPLYARMSRGRYDLYEGDNDDDNYDADDSRRSRNRSRSRRAARRQVYDDEKDKESSVGYRESRRVREDLYDDDEDYDNDYSYDEGDDDDDEEEAIANFWSNPVLGLDNDVNLMDEVPDESRRRRRPRPRRSFKNINKTRSPSFLKDFYNTLFWYGIEFEDENDDAYEPSSIFGGTRGKFDGRKYIEDDDTINGSNDDNDDLDNFPVRGRRRQQPLQSRQGINDRYNVSGTRKRRQRPPSSRRGAAYLREEWSEKSWTEEEVSSWFDDDDASDSTYQQRRKYFADDMFNDLRRADHKRRKKAAEWDESYAFDINRSRISRESQPDLENIVDVEVQVEKTKNDEKKINGIDGAERQNRSRKFESNQDQVSVEQRAKIKEKEDAEKRERVPPNGIVAWGPLGEIKGKDVRQKAAEEAIDQIKNAQISLEKQKAKLIAAEERMQVTRVTAVLQRKRISEVCGCSIILCIKFL